MLALSRLYPRHKQGKKGHTSASQAGSVAHWMRRCVSDASALAERSYGGSIHPRSALFNFSVSQAFASTLGTVSSANRPTFEASQKYCGQIWLPKIGSFQKNGIHVARFV